MRWLLHVALTICLLSPMARAQQPAAEPPAAEAPGAEAPGAKTQAREQQIIDYLSGAKFVGRYTSDRDPAAAAKPETYTISKVEKLPEPDRYRLTSRIEYGDTNTEVPIDLQILWSGRTPVITLDNVWIPAMGTFSARVLIHEGRYAGTWSHDEHGGHLFGRIERAEQEPPRD